MPKALVLVPDVKDGRFERASRIVQTLQDRGHDARWLAPDERVNRARKEGCSLLVLIGFPPEEAEQLAAECARQLPDCMVIAEQADRGFVRLNGATHACGETIEAILGQIGQ